MKVIGLTGNIGCGKSTVADMLRELGVAIIDLDAVARQVRNNDADVRRRLSRPHGPQPVRACAAQSLRQRS